VLTASFDKTARIWDAESGREIALLEGALRVKSAGFRLTASARHIAPLQTFLHTPRLERQRNRRCFGTIARATEPLLRRLRL
jgi:hypothetical protein